MKDEQIFDYASFFKNLVVQKAGLLHIIYCVGRNINVGYGFDTLITSNIEVPFSNLFSKKC